MGVTRKVTKIGGSLGVLIPRDFAAAMNVIKGTEVSIFLVGRQLVIEPLGADEGTVDDKTFRRAFATVLRRNASELENRLAYEQNREEAPGKSR